MGAMSQLQVKAGNSARLFIGLQGVSINGGPWQCPLSTSIGRPFTVLHQRKQGQYVTQDMSAVKQACIPDTGMDRSLPDFIMVPGMVQGQ